MSLTISKKAQSVKPSSTLAITAMAKALKATGVDVVGFGAGEPDFDTPENVREAGIYAINNGYTKYTTTSGTNELKSAICKKFKNFNHLTYTPAQIVVSNGGKQGLSNALMAICDPGDEVIIPSPYWLSYPEMVKLADGIPVFVEGPKKNGYKITAKQLEKAITPKTKAVIINSPNNPTGMVYTEEELRAIADVIVRHDIYCISDEMYENLIYTGEGHVSIASFNEEIYKRTITCSGLSKSYSMTGWRIGYTASSIELAKAMGAMQSHMTSNPNSIAQFAAVEALEGPQTSVSFMKKNFNSRRVLMYKTLKKMKYIDVLEPQGAFYVFVDVSELLKKKYNGETIETVDKLAKILIEDYAVAIIPCTDFGFSSHIRLSYAISPGQITKGLDRISKFIDKVE